MMNLVLENNWILFIRSMKAFIKVTKVLIGEGVQLNIFPVSQRLIIQLCSNQF